MINGNIDIFLTSKARVEKTYLTAQFSLQGFCDPYRFEFKRYGGCTMFYIRDDIHSGLTEKKFQKKKIKTFLLKLIKEIKHGFFVPHITVIGILHHLILIF